MDKKQLSKIKRDLDMAALHTAIEWSILQLEKPRERRKTAIQEMAGAHYAEKGAQQVVPVNYIELAVSIYSHQLAAQSPKAYFTSDIRELRPQAIQFGLAVNQRVKEIEFDDTLNEVIVDAMLSCGIIKKGISRSGYGQNEEDIGESYADRVSFDNYFVDMSASSRREIQYEGNDYWIDFNEAKDIYGDKVIADEYTYINQESGQESAESITRDDNADVYRDRVRLRDVYLPLENVLVTYQPTQKTGEPLSVIPFDGPEGGPYEVLGFSTVPDQLLPLPPVAVWRDLHTLANQVFRKVANQVMAKKRVAGFSGDDEESAAKLASAKDGEGISYKGQPPQNIDVGGIDPQALAFFLSVRDQVSYHAGNLDALGGLSPTSETIGQDRLISEAANARISSMRSKLIKFLKNTYRTIAWYEWTDPVRKRKVVQDIDGTDIQIVHDWNEETREGDFLDFNFDINVHSMQDQSPAVKLQKLTSVLQSYVIPLEPLLRQSGFQIDGEEIMRIVSEWSDMPELRDVLTFSQELMEEQRLIVGSRDAERGGAKPAQTTRRYVRESRPGSTRAGRDNVMARALMGAGVQPSEEQQLNLGGGIA